MDEPLATARLKKKNKSDRIAHKIATSELAVGHPYIYAIDIKGKAWALTWDDLRYLSIAYMAARTSRERK